MAGAGVAPGPAAHARAAAPSVLTRLLALGTYDSLLAGILFLAVLLACGLTPMQTDTWWQLRAGKDMWASGSVMLSDTYSHTASGTFWLNHEWLAEVIFYACYRLGGFPLLTIFCALLIASGWMLTWALTRGPARPVFVIVLLALVSSTGWWEPRPHAFSLLFIPGMIYLLEREKGRWLPLVFLVWANCHGGVLLGLALLAVGLVARSAAGRSGWRQSAVLLLACAAAMTLTPIGIDFWIEIPKSLARINLYPLDEWDRPEWSDYTLIPFWGIAMAYVIMLARNVARLRSMSPAEATLHACSLALLAGALGAVRNVGPFLMTGVPALTHLWYGTRGAQSPGLARPEERRVVNLAILAVASVGVVLTLNAAYRDQWPRLKWTPIPEAALVALRDCPDNLYNRYDEGGMLLWFAPERKVFLDGRQDPFPPPLVLEHIAMETGRADYKDTFARHDIRCAFLPVVSPVASRLTADGWIPLYRGSQWVVFRQ